MRVKDRIKEEIKKNGMTLEQVAQIVGTTKPTIQKYESGIISNIPSEKIELLAKALKTTPAALMGWDTKSAPEDALTKQIIDSFNSLSEDKKQQAAAFILYLAESQRKE